MPLSHDQMELSPDALAVADGYCPLHRGIHAFEIVRPRVDTKMDPASLPNGKLSTHILRSPFACAVQRPVDIQQIESTTVAERWHERLEVEKLIKSDSSLVSVETRTALLIESLIALNSALEIPVDRMNRSIAKHSLFAVGAFSFFFAGLLATHFSVFTYASVLSLTVALLTPFVSKNVFSRRWRNSVIALVPSALAPLALTREQVNGAIRAMTPAPQRLKRRKTLQKILELAETPTPDRPLTPR